jgi:hypothetical protein
MKVKSVFLHGDITGDIYMEQPLGFENDGSFFCRLKKSLYILKLESV